MRAWTTAHDLDIEAALENFGSVPYAVNLLDSGQVRHLISKLLDLPTRPALVVFDTLARCMAGGDENSAKDMGTVIDQLDRVKQDVGTATLVVHHSTKASTSTMRGSSALSGAADTVAHLSRVGPSAMLKCTKQKDAALFAPWLFAPVEVAGSYVLHGRSKASADADDVAPQEALPHRIETFLHASCGESFSKAQIREAVGGRTEYAAPAIDEAVDDPTSPVGVIPGSPYDRFCCTCSEPTGL